MSHAPMTPQLKRATLVTSMVASFITPFLGGALNIALPSIADEFHMSSTLLPWVASAFLLATVVCLVPVGRWADMVGRKKIFFWGSIVILFGSLLALLAPTMSVFLLARVIQGIGGAMAFSTSMAILTSVFPPSERGKAIGFSVTSVYLGGALGPIIGGLLVHYLGWRSVFALNLVLVSIIPILVHTQIQGEWKNEHSQHTHMDWPGVMSYAILMLALMSAPSFFPTIAGWVLLVLGLIGLVLFIVIERRVSHPVIDVRLFSHNATFAFSNLAALIHYAATFGIGLLLGLYLQMVRGYSAQTAGLILFVQPIFMSIVSPFAGHRSDTIEPRILATIGMGLTGLGVLGLAFLTQDTPLIYLVACLICLGVGFGLFSSPNTNAIMTSVDQRHLGIASSIVGVMRMTGQTFSMGIVSALFALILGHSTLTSHDSDAFMRCLHIAFGLFATLCALGATASMKRGNLRR